MVRLLTFALLAASLSLWSAQVFGNSPCGALDTAYCSSGMSGDCYSCSPGQCGHAPYWSCPIPGHRHPAGTPCPILGHAFGLGQALGLGHAFGLGKGDRGGHDGDGGDGRDGRGRDGRDGRDGRGRDGRDGFGFGGGLRNGVGNIFGFGNYADGPGEDGVVVHRLGSNSAGAEYAEGALERYMIANANRRYATRQMTVGTLPMPAGPTPTGVFDSFLTPQQYQRVRPVVAGMAPMPGHPGYALPQGHVMPPHGHILQVLPLPPGYGTPQWFAAHGLALPLGYGSPEWFGEHGLALPPGFGTPEWHAALAQVGATQPDTSHTQTAALPPGYGTPEWFAAHGLPLPPGYGTPEWFATHGLPLPPGYGTPEWYAAHGLALPPGYGTPEWFAAHGLALPPGFGSPEWHAGMARTTALAQGHIAILTPGQAVPQGHSAVLSLGPAVPQGHTAILPPGQVVPLGHTAVLAPVPPVPYGHTAVLPPTQTSTLGHSPVLPPSTHVPSGYDGYAPSHSQGSPEAASERIVYIPYAMPPQIQVERIAKALRIPSMRQVLGDTRTYEYPEMPLNMYTTRGPRDFFAPNPPSIGY